MKSFGVEFEGFVEQSEQLEKMLMANPKTDIKVRKIIRQVIREAREQVSNSIRSGLGRDPRQAHKAVKMAVYKKLLGGYVSILDKKGPAGPKTSYVPPRRLREGQRGGNRVPRSKRTQEVMDYGGPDREFVLRFVEAGTAQRQAGTRAGRLSGNRGSIAPRNIFATASWRAIQKASDEFVKLLDELFEKEIVTQ